MSKVIQRRTLWSGYLNPDLTPKATFVLDVAFSLHSFLCRKRMVVVKQIRAQSAGERSILVNCIRQKWPR